MENARRTLLFAVAMHAATVGAEPTPDQVVEYKAIDSVRLSLHIFNPPEHTPADERPAIVFYFGGGWVNGTPKQFYPQSEYLASRGMVAICADYRVRSRHKTTPRECVMDGKSAIRWVRSHAGELGIDPGRIVAAGGSAGGHVAAATGAIPGFEQDGEDTSVSSRPDALALFNPVFNNGPDGYGHDRVKEYWRGISPLHNIDAGAPPTIVFLGDQDHLIPVSTAQEYKRKMESVGGRCDLHIYENERHGFFNKSKYVETTTELDRFLASLGYLAGEPTLSRESDTPRQQEAVRKSSLSQLNALPIGHQ